MAARSHHQNHSDFNPQPWLPMHRDRMNLPLSSAYRPVRIGCLHTSLVGRYRGWGAFGGLSRRTVGMSSNPSASPATEVLSPLNGWVMLGRYVQIPSRLRSFRLSVQQWVTDSGWNTSRLPPLGPAVLASLPTLVLVTQNLQVQLCGVRSGPQQPKIAIASCSLEKHDEFRDPNAAPSNHDLFESRYCTQAAIGLGYNGSHNLLYPEFRFKCLKSRVCNSRGNSLTAERPSSGIILRFARDRRSPRINSTFP